MSFESLRKEAKRWLRALDQGDAEARARLARIIPNPPDVPTLRAVQHALARERGFPGWTALKAHFEQQDKPARLPEAVVNHFLAAACPDHHVRGRADHARARGTALRLLARYPGLREHSFVTRVVCGDLAGVERMLAEQPDLAGKKTGDPKREQSEAGGQDDLTRKDLGPKGWEPLLYLCFTRLPLPQVEENAVAIAKLLLDHGADPTVYFQAGGSSYTPLVGAIGEGEEDRPPHQRRDELVQLLLDRGANPYDNQVIYNLGFHGQVIWFLEKSYQRALVLGRKADWDDPQWMMLNMGGYGTGARWHLEMAIRHNNIELARWCLEHGATPNAAPKRDKRFPQMSLYEGAVRLGRTEIAELLLQYGAERVEVKLDPMERFLAACFRLDRAAVEQQLAEHPEFLERPEPLLKAAEQNRTDVIELLLDRGMSPDVRNEHNERPLHMAAYNNSIDAAKLLIARGAEIDPVEKHWSNTPMGAAAWPQHREMIDLLAPLSKDVWELTMAGKLDRLRELITEKPERARVSWNGHTPLMWLPPEDEGLALEIAELLLANGADPTSRNPEGQTAADRAERLGMYEVAELLEARG